MHVLYNSTHIYIHIRHMFCKLPEFKLLYIFQFPIQILGKNKTVTAKYKDREGEDSTLSRKKKSIAKLATLSE